MPVPKLPKTTVRLATATSFYMVREDAVGSKAILGRSDSDTTQTVISRMVQVFAISSFRESQDRTTSSRWEVDSDVPGRALEVFQQPLDRTLTIKRAVLYDSDFIQATGYTNELVARTGVPDGSILSQLNKPFILIKKDTSPNGPSVMTLYRGCVFSSLSKTYDLNSSNIAVIEDAVIRYAGRQQITT